MNWAKKAVTFLIMVLFLLQSFSSFLKAEDNTKVEKNDQKEQFVKIVDLPLIDKKSANYQQNLNYCLSLLNRFVDVLKKPSFKDLNESEKKTVYEVVYLYGQGFCAPYLLDSGFLKKFEGLDKISKDKLSVLFHSTIYKLDSFKTDKSNLIKEVLPTCSNNLFENITSCLLNNNVLPTSADLASLELELLPFVLKANFKEKIDVYFFDYSGLGMRGIKVYKDTMKKLKEKGENYLFCWLRFPGGSGKFDKPEDFIEITYHQYGQIECPAFHLEKKMVELRTQGASENKILTLRSQENLVACSNATLIEEFTKKMADYTRGCADKKECQKKTDEFLEQVNYTTPEAVLRSLNSITGVPASKEDFCIGKETKWRIKKGWLDFYSVSFLNPHQGFEKTCREVTLEFWGEMFFRETKNVLNWFTNEFGNRGLL